MQIGSSTSHLKRHPLNSLAIFLELLLVENIQRFILVSVMCVSVQELVCTQESKKGPLEFRKGVKILGIVVGDNVVSHNMVTEN